MTTPLTDSPATVLSEYLDLNRQIKALEGRRDEIKARLAIFVPEGNTRASYPTVIDGMPYRYMVTKVTQDRRVLNDDLLVALLRDLKVEASAVVQKAVPDPKAVKDLLAVGVLTKKMLATCMTGPMPTYFTVSLLASGEETE